MAQPHTLSEIAARYHLDHPLKPKTLNELITIPADRLHQVDIARVNLLCAEGMPGTDDLDVNHACQVLDRWAERVAYETDRHLYRVTDPRYAEHYRQSEAFLESRVLVAGAAAGPGREVRHGFGKQLRLC